jgi:hypothetical protein
MRRNQPTLVGKTFRLSANPDAKVMIDAIRKTTVSLHDNHGTKATMTLDGLKTAIAKKILVETPAIWELLQWN